MKPYQRNEQFTKLDNWFWDVAMPKLPPTTWKIFCFIYRKTRGWQKDKTSLSHREIARGTGINSRNTIKKAIECLKNEGMITVIRFNGSPDTYCLNLDLDVPDPYQKMTPLPKNGGGPLPKNGGGPLPKNGGGPLPKNGGALKERKEKEKKKDPAGTAAAADSKLDEILSTLETVSEQMQKPLAVPEKVAEVLLKRGETKSSVLNAWQTCQQNATRSVGGSFINWINSNWLPTTNTNSLTVKTNNRQNPPPPNSAAPPAPQSAPTSVDEIIAMREERNRRRRRRK